MEGPIPGPELGPGPGPWGPGVDEPELPAGLPTNPCPCGPEAGPHGTSCDGPPPPPGVCGGPGEGPGNEEDEDPWNPGVPGPGMMPPVGVDGPGGVP